MGCLPTAVLRQLRARHLLAATWRAGERWYALRHDVLAEPVARLARWAPRDLAARFADTPAAFLRAAEVAMADGNLELARRHAEAALRGARGSDLKLCGAAESLLGNAAYLRGDLQHAEERYRAATETFEALRDTGAVAGLLAAVGKSLLAQGRHGAAIEHLHSAVGRIPNDLTVQTELAWALWPASSGPRSTCSPACSPSTAARPTPSGRAGRSSPTWGTRRPRCATLTGSAGRSHRRRWPRTGSRSRC